MIRSEAPLEAPSICRFFLRWSRPLVLKNFSESADGDSLLDLSKDLLFLGEIGKFLLTCQVTLGKMTVFAMLGFIKIMETWSCKISAVLSLLEQMGEICRFMHLGLSFCLRMENSFFFVIVKVSIVNLAAFSSSTFMWGFLSS